MREPVFVLVGKLVKYPENEFMRLVPSRVRLQPLDDCSRAWMNAPNHAFEGFRSILGIAPEHGERNVSLDTFRERLPFVSDGEFVDEVIEGGAEVVQTVPDNGGEFGRHGLEDLDYEQLVAALKVSIMDQSVRLAFEPDGGFALKALHVVERPI